MAADHRKAEIHTKEESLRAWVGDAEARSIRYLLKQMVKALTGRDFEVLSYEPIDLGGQGAAEESGGTGDGDAAGDPSAERAGWGLEYDYHEVDCEKEETRFTAGGVVRTADGREIAFQTELFMSREYYREMSVSVRAGDAVRVDPLVINFAGDAAELTDGKFTFDLDADGTTEEISHLDPGSGFLVFDRNGDGIVNDGQELFGTETGDGFGELAGYDLDGNHWIDGNDSMLDNLGVWTRKAEGTDSLVSLRDLGVGAIYLGNVASPFELWGGADAAHGAVRSTGLFVCEDGTVGTMQQLDLYK